MSVLDILRQKILNDTDKAVLGITPRMVTKDEIKQAFLADLHALLEKYNAEITTEDHWTGYAECGSDIRMTVEIAPVYKDGECESEQTSIDLGKFIGKG
jgi:hypothetical protein